MIDAVGWGDATNAFVEGVAAPAPAAGTSLERLPGGPDGNGEDTNDNATDWFLQASPGPQGLSAPLVPGPGGPVPTPVPTPTMTPSPTSTVSPTASPSPPRRRPRAPARRRRPPRSDADREPVADPVPDPDCEPDRQPDAQPVADADCPDADGDPDADRQPDAESDPDPTQAIAAARAAADGSIVTVVATLTTDLGALESGHTAFVQDATAGIAIYLTTPATATIPAGTRVRVTGEVSSRYAQRTIRVDEPDAIVTLDAPGLPAAHGLATGLADEASEGLRIATSGTLLAGRDELADGTAVSIDDGSGPVRLVIAPGALAGVDLTTGSQVAASGPLGQRDSTGSGTTGYRLYVTRPGDLVVSPPPTPSPTVPPTPSPSIAPSPTPSANPTGTATPAPTVAPTATPAPTSSLSVDPIVDARQQPVGASVTVRGTVTAEPGRLGTPPLIAIQDATGGIVVRLPDDAARPARGDVLVVTGALADPYGQLEVRPKGVTGVLRVDRVTGPAATQVTTLGESTEGRLVTIVGTIATKPAKASSGDLTFDLEVAGGRRLRLAADASSRIAATSLTTGWTVRVTGIGGQRASRKGALDGYRVWLRDPADIVRTAGPSAAPTSSPSPTTGHTATPAPSATGASSTPVRSIAAAIRTTDDVRIRAVVTAGRTLLDSSGRRIVVQDASGAVEFLLPADIAAPGPGARVEVAGRMGTAYGAPRLRATDLERLGSDAVPAPLEVRGALTKAHTWRLVRIHGRIEDTRKLGDRVRAEIAVGAQRIVVVGQPSVGLTSDDLLEGATVTITGVVRAAYPNATDQRPSLLPRSKRDVQVQGRGAVQGASGSATGADAGGAAAAGADGAASNGDGGPGDATSGAGVPDADLRRARRGRRADGPGRWARRRPDDRRLHARRRHGHRRRGPGRIRCRPGTTHRTDRCHQRHRSRRATAGRRAGRGRRLRGRRRRPGRGDARSGPWQRRVDADRPRAVLATLARRGRRRPSASPASAIRWPGFQGPARA